MRIYYDGAIYAIQSRGGINRYFTSLIEALGDRIEGLLSYTKPLHSLLPVSSKLSTVGMRRFGFWPGRASYYLEGRYFKFRRNYFAPEILHPTYYELLTQEVHIPKGVPVVATIFDLIHERFPAATDPTGKTRQLKKNLIERADAIITTSQHSKENLQEFYGLPAERISLVYPGTSFTVGPTAALETIPEPFLLFVGNRWVYKNFPVFLKALARAIQLLPSLRAIIVGPALSDAENQIVDQLTLRDHIQVMGYIDDQELSQLYSTATALVYPSSYEGFGFPVIEAQVHGCPVITSNISSLPEAAGAGAIFVMPSDTDGIVDAIVRVAQSSDLRRDLRIKGIENAKRFSWQSCADQVYQVYQSLLS